MMCFIVGIVLYLLNLLYSGGYGGGGDAIMHRQNKID